MIIDRVILHNFGPYHGRHVFELTPAPGQPISLLIGLNGAGKTTFLHALQIAFYGAQAPAVDHFTSLSGCTFDEFLADSICYWPEPADSASIEVEFRAARAGREQHLLVRRFWKRSNGTVSGHRLEVFVDGTADPAMTGAWPEVVEELLPLPLSTLFFFDGEKIDRWANALSTADLITQAVRSLLGLDVIDRALADLDVLRRKASHSEVLKEEYDLRQQLELSRAEVARLEHRHRELDQQLAGARGEVERAEKESRELELQLQSRGLPLLNRRAELEAIREGRQHQLTLTRERLRAQRTQDERRRRDRERWSELLRCRDSAMIEAAPADFRAWLETWLREQATRDFVVDADTPAPEGEPSTDTSTRISHQLIQRLDSELRQTLALIDQIPPPETVTPLLARRDELLANLQRARARFETLETDLQPLNSQLERDRIRLQRLEEEMARTERTHDQSRRLRDAASASADALTRFRIRLIQQVLDEIARHTEQNFTTLLHKTDLFDRVQIEQSQQTRDLRFSLRLELQGRPRDPQRFSAGERQMLALSLLWAFAQTSQWRAPMVIDTPLARLDSNHRQNVVRSFIPAAGQQVIILATDLETVYFRGSTSVGRRITMGIRPNRQVVAVTAGSS
jgi:DNA sulfur modification protein DndD